MRYRMDTKELNTAYPFGKGVCKYHYSTWMTSGKKMRVGMGWLSEPNAELRAQTLLLVEHEILRTISLSTLWKVHGTAC